MIPNDFRPPSTVRRYFYDWRDNGLLHRINHALIMMVREFEGHEVQPTAGIIDSQTVKTTKSVVFVVMTSPLVICLQMPVGQWTKKIKGRKRHILTGTIGFLIGFVIHSADIQDRNALPGRQLRSK